MYVYFTTSSITMSRIPFFSPILRLSLLADTNNMGGDTGLVLTGTYGIDKRSAGAGVLLEMAVQETQQSRQSQLGGDGRFWAIRKC